jgi:hypothetical protein
MEEVEDFFAIPTPEGRAEAQRLMQMEPFNAGVTVQNRTDEEMDNFMSAPVDLRCYGALETVDTYYDNPSKDGLAEVMRLLDCELEEYGM